WDGIEEAYQNVKRKPKSKKFEEMEMIFKSLTRHSWEWVREWASEAVTQLSARRSSGLNMDEVGKHRDLVKVLLDIENQSETVQKRMFSLRLFGNSKHFEKEVQSRLVHL